MALDATDSTDYEAIRAAMLEKAGDRALGFHGNASFNDGMPPGVTAIVSPLDFKLEVDSGEVAMIDTPMGKLGVELQTIHGAPKGTDLKSGYAQAAQPSPENVASMPLDNTLKLGAMDLTPPTGGSSSS